MSTTPPSSSSRDVVDDNNTNNTNNAQQQQPRKRDELRELSQLLKKYAGHSSASVSESEARRRGIFQR